MSATADSTFTNPEQRIADLERQLAESQAERDAYKAERDEALERETATAEVLGVINSSPGDLAPVFDAMLEKATALCEAAFGTLATYDGQRFAPAAEYGVPIAFATFRSERGAFAPPPGSSLERVVNGANLVHIADATADPDQAAAPLVQLGQCRSLVCVALRKDNRLVGAITAYRQELRPFTDKQIALLGNFAAQAVIAMENARLITETREALEQQTATAEVLGVINSSPGNLQPVFDAMLEKAMLLCDAAFGVMHKYNSGSFYPLALHGVPPAYSELLLREPLKFEPDTALGRIEAGEDIISSADAAEDYAQASPLTRTLQEVGGIRSVVFVSLRKDGVLLGVLVAYRQEARAFSAKQIALLQNFAQQAVIAMENARLLTETREALEQQTATAEVLQVINSSPGDLAPVFEAILEKAHILCEAAHGHLTVYDGEMFRTVAMHGVDSLADLLSRPFSLERGSLQEHLLQGDNLIHIPDIANTDLGTVKSARWQMAIEAGFHTVIFIPLRRDNALLGYITAYRREVRPFTDKQITLLQNFAAQAVIAMENARLLTETREALEQQTATAEVLGVINSSPGDLAPVFDAILEKAHTLCGAGIGALLTFDGESFHFLARKGPPELAEVAGQPFKPVSQNRLNDLIQGEPLLHILDARELLALAPEDAHTRRTVGLGGMRTFLAVPLRKDDRLIGAITAARQEVRAFSYKEIALLQNFAAQAVIAMENARLITETREALDQQTATAEVLGVINSSPGDLGPVFDAMLNKATRLCEAAFGVLHTYDGERFNPVALQGVPTAFAEFLKRNRPGFGPGTAPARLLEGERFVHEVDLTNTDSYRAGVPARRALVDLGGARSMVTVPLLRDDGVHGSFTIYRQEVRPFADKQIELLQNFAAQAVIAMENARLMNETREALEQQTATAEVLGVINSSPGDLAPVFNAILEKAHKLCGVSHGSLQLYEDGLFRAVATRGVAAEAASHLRQPREPGSAAKQLLAGARFHEVADQAEVVEQSPSPVLSGQMDWRTQGIVRRLFMPLRQGRSLLGMIVAGRTEVRPFVDKEIALLENFAQQAVIAMDNARLLDELRQRTDQVAELNRGLEARVAEQVDELGRVGRLKRFLAPQLAELIVSHGDEKILESHRREIVVVFCDLRGYTAFTETAEPEEVLEFLRQYHGALGPLVSQFEGTLDQFSGDGIMVFFNDPVPCPDPAERAVKMAMAMRDAASMLIADWRERGRELGFGVGIAQGYATLGQIGFTDRSGYTAIGTVCNVAARLCAEAKDGQILLSQRVNVGLKGSVVTDQIGALALKGLTQPVVAYNVPLALSQPALHVIEGGGPQRV